MAEVGSFSLSCACFRVYDKLEPGFDKGPTGRPIQSYNTKPRVSAYNYQSDRLMVIIGNNPILSDSRLIAFLVGRPTRCGPRTGVIGNILVNYQVLLV